MKIATTIVRVLLGLAFIVFGLNAFLNFIPTPPPPQGLAGDFAKVFMASGYAKWIGAFQIIGGLLLFIPRFVPLGLTILGGIIVNILIFHATMSPKEIGPGLVVAALALFLAWQYRGAFASLVGKQP
jgi:putative oxidoreductase